MSQVAEMLRHAAEVQNRLRYPPNSVTDNGIDLKRREPPKMTEEPKIAAAFVLPYAIGTITPSYSLSYDVPYRRPEGPLTVRVIQRAVCQRYGITFGDMLSERRTHNLVRPRQVAMYLTKELTGRSYPEIGRRFGGRDHTTVMHGFRKIKALRESDPVLNAIIVELFELLVASPAQTEDAPCSSLPNPTSTAP